MGGVSGAFQSADEQPESRPAEALSREAENEPTRRLSPADKKALAYRKDHRLWVKYPQLHRRAWPKKKALRNQTYRRQVKRALTPALGSVTSEIDDFSPDPTRRRKSRWSLFGGTLPLGESVEWRQRQRFRLLGRKLLGNLHREQHRKRLVPFLTTLIEGHGEHSRDLAHCFSVLLQPAPPGWPNGWRGNEHERDLVPGNWWGWHFVLHELFREQPEWEGKLRRWIASFEDSRRPRENTI